MFLAGSLTLSPQVRHTPAQPTAAPPASFTTVSTFQIQEATLADLQAQMASGHLTSRALVQQYLDRIERYDKQGPKINAILELNPEALAIADQLDQERRAGQLRGPLHGIPILLKGNIATHDQMTTTAGSAALAGSVPKQDAFLVTRLRAAGAVILGKANLTEFANFMAYDMPSGYSALGGQTLNPYRPMLNKKGQPILSPCGSSAGSGAATAANLTAVAIGTETSGSILCPADANSLVGIKTTVGLVSRSGIIPIAASQDVAGPMTRTVADAAALLNVLAGYDPTDPVTAQSKDKIPADYRLFLKPDGLQGVRIGIPRGFYKLDREQKVLFDRAIATLKRQGATIIDPAVLTTAKKLLASDLTVLTYEFKRDLNTYLATLGPTAPVRTLAEVIRFNRTHPEQALKYGQQLLIDADKRRLQKGTEISEARYHRARASELRLAKTEGVDATMDRYQLDALLFPMDYGSFIGAIAGYPTVIVPAGYTSKGTPMGLSFLGKAFQEPRLIQYAYAYEQASQLRRPPAATP
ncbi:amidase [Anthocerotibacter panamensis]|uniref:amidase n=1 Tax=Anthocerotibacter panamensis TaxID=2857077 RepID=UPI001C4041AA